MSSALHLLIDSGPSITQSYDSFRTFINGHQHQFNNLIVFLIIAIDDPRYNGTIIGEVLKNCYPQQDWTEVIDSLDEANLEFRSTDCCENLLRLIISISNEYLVYFFSKSWRNLSFQCTFIQTFIQIPKQNLKLYQIRLPKVISHNDVKNSPDHSIQEIALSYDDQLFNIYDLVRLLFDCASRTNSESEPITLLLDAAVKLSPELLIIGIIKSPKPWTNLQDRALSSLAFLFVTENPLAIFVFYIILQQDKNIFVKLFIDCYNRSRATADRMTEIAHELNVLNDILRSLPVSLSIDFACCASRKGWINFENYLLERWNLFGDDFTIAALDFLDKKSLDEYTQNQEVNLSHQLTCPLYLPVAAALLNFFFNVNVPTNRIEQLRIVQTQSVQTYSRLMNWGQGHDLEILSSAELNTFNIATEKEMKLYYQKMYEQEISIADIVIFLLQLKTSNGVHEQDVFACMVHSLFDEYRFFPEYPLTALATTAVLFGSIIQFKIVEGIVLSVALRCVLESLSESTESKMFKFGIQALHQFQSRLHEFPKFCTLLSPLASLESIQPQLYQKIKQITYRANAQIIPFDVLNLAVDTPVEELADSQIVPPPSATSALGANNIPSSNNQNNTIEATVSAAISSPALISSGSVVPSSISAVSRSSLIHGPDSTSTTNPTPVPGNFRLNSSNEEQLVCPPYLSIHADTLFVNNEYVDPSEEVQDKILFIVNNVAKNNLSTKATELKDLLLPSFFRWFSNYIVEQRAKQEPNYHSLYLQMLKLIGNATLDKEILCQAYSSVVKVLNNKETIHSSAERAHLKNLGSWLGGLTIGQDKPIKFKNLSFKHLLIEGYESKTLILVLPFSCKVLEQSIHSRIFKPPNPWLIGILRVMAELYNFAELKLNLKFEIEVLCKNLKLEISDIQPSCLIRDRSSKKAAATAAAAAAASVSTANISSEMERLDLNGQSAAQRQAELFRQVPRGLDPMSLNSSIPAIPGASGQIHTPVIQQQMLANNIHPPNNILPTMGSSVIGANNTSVPASVGAQSVVANNAPIQYNGNTVFITHPTLKRMLHLSVDKAVREVIASVVERAVSISGIACRELVLKDFALEVDENKLRIAAQNLAQNLSGSLALVTCKEPLKAAISANLKTILANNGYSEHNLPPDSINICIADNIDMLCDILERAAMDKSIGEIEEVMSQAYIMRKRHKELNPGQPYVDPAASRYALSLPDPFRLTPGGLTLQQFSIYENFSRINANTINSMERSKDSTGLSEYREAYAQAAPAIASQRLMHVDPELGEQMSLNNMQKEINEEGAQLQHAIEVLIFNCKEVSETSLDKVNSFDRVKVLVTQILTLIQQSNCIDHLIMKLSQYIISSLFTIKETNFTVEVLVFLLEKLNEILPDVFKDVIHWLLNSEDERKYNVTITIILIRAGLLFPTDLDLSLSRFLNNNPIAIKYATDLICEAVLGKPAIGLRTDFAACIGVLESIPENSPSRILVDNMLEALNSQNSSVATTDVPINDQMGFVFAEWIRLIQHPAKTEKLLNIFVFQVIEKGVLDSSSKVVTFIKNSMDMCFEWLSGNPMEENFLPFDALASLMVLVYSASDIPKEVKKDSNELYKSNKFGFLGVVTTAIILILSKDHESNGKNFNEKPYFHLFSAMLCEWVKVGSEDDEMNNIFYLNMTRAFTVLQPVAFPRFTFSWIALISHRFYMPRLLRSSDPIYWSYVRDLLISLFKFLGTYLSSSNIPQIMKVIYKGSVRVILVILHDFPEFIDYYTHTLCGALPYQCIQLRNLLLSAFPRGFYMPNPFVSNLLSNIPAELLIIPRVSNDPEDLMTFNGLKYYVDAYLKLPMDSPTGDEIITLLVSKLKTKPTVVYGIGFSEVKVNPEFIRTVVIYVGNKYVDKQRVFNEEGANVSKREKSDNKKELYYAFLVKFVKAIGEQGRYFAFVAIVDQLRYPNIYTFYYVNLLIYLFSNSGFENDLELIQAQILRVVLERLMCSKPHPWGLLVAFSGLVRNSKLKFWDVTSSIANSDIEKLLSSLAVHLRAIVE